MTILIRERGSEHCIHRIREVEVKSDVCNSRRNLEIKEIEICYVCMRLGGFKLLFADTDKFRSFPKKFTPTYSAVYYFIYGISHNFLTHFLIMKNIWHNTAFLPNQLLSVVLFENLWYFVTNSIIRKLTFYL